MNEESEAPLPAIPVPGLWVNVSRWNPGEPSDDFVRRVVLPTAKGLIECGKGLSPLVFVLDPTWKLSRVVCTDVRALSPNVANLEACREQCRKASAGAAGCMLMVAGELTVRKGVPFETVILVESEFRSDLRGRCVRKFPWRMVGARVQWLRPAIWWPDRASDAARVLGGEAIAIPGADAVSSLGLMPLRSTIWLPDMGPGTFSK